MIHLHGVLAAAGEVQRFCQARQWAFCLIGGVAVQLVWEAGIGRTNRPQCPRIITVA